MKNILLLVHDDAGQEARLQAALDLTRSLEGHLTCVDVSMFPMVTGEFYGGVADAMIVADEREQESRNKSVVSARLAHEGVPWNWIDAVGDPVNCVLDAATLADLIILNRKLDSLSYPDMRNIASRILMKAHKPIVAVPEPLRGFKTGRAMIAWDGKPSVAATMRACVPLLALATDVRIVMVHRSRDEANADDADAYLSNHGIIPDVRLVVDDGLHTIDAIIALQASDWHADYILMGAYSHGRLMEAFGGVTKRMLTHCNLPLVLGH